jgi:hypothetical protein
MANSTMSQTLSSTDEEVVRPSSFRCFGFNPEAAMYVLLIDKCC